MASGLTDEQVETMILDHEHLQALVGLRNEISQKLASLCFDIHLQHNKLMGYFGTPLLRMAFLAWADRNMVSQDLDARRRAQLIRSMLERNNLEPLFLDSQIGPETT